MTERWSGWAPTRVVLSLWAVFALALIAWAGATPMVASPDEPAHVIKAASVVRGEFIGERTDRPAVTIVQVPSSLAGASSWTCYAFNPDVAANCIPPIPVGLDLVDAETSAGLYNPTYYLLVGWPSLFIADGEMSILAMRAVSAVVVSFFLALGAFGMSRAAGPVIAGVTTLAAVTPMVGFLGGMVNPNAFEIATTFSLTAALLVLGRSAGAASARWLAVVAVSSVLLANTRGLSPLWLGLVGVLALVWIPKARLIDLVTQRRVQVVLGVLVAGALAAVTWVLATNTLASMGMFPGAGETSPATAFVVMLLRTFDPGVIGVFGWLDTFAPAMTYAVWSLLILGVVVAGLAVARGRKLLVTSLALAAVVLLPPIVQAASVQNSGYIWQGRYTIAAIVILLAFAGAAFADVVVVRGHRRFAAIVVVIAAVAWVWAFGWAARRYMVGEASSDPLFFRSAVWAPPLGLWPWLALTVAAFVLAGVVWLRAVRRDERVPELS